MNKIQSNRFLILIAAASFLAPNIAFSAESQVLAVQAGILPTSPHGAGKGEVPQELRSNPFEFGDWPSGTGLLLRTKLPDGAQPSLQDHTIISFVDDTGKNLAKLPEGVGFKGFGGREFKPVVALFDTKTQDVYVAVRSLKSPNQKATKVFGEIALSIAHGEAPTVESVAFSPSRGQGVNVGPFVLSISEYGRPQEDSQRSRNAPPGFPSQPPMPANMKFLQYSILDPKKTGQKISSVEILGSGGKVLSKTDKTDFVIGTEHTYGVYISEAGPLKIRIAVLDPTKLETFPITFQTSIGVSEE